MDKISQDISLLRQKSECVDSADEASSIIDRLEKVLKSTDNGVGLAAIQIGIPKKVGVIQSSRGNVHLINPTIVEAEDEFVYFSEGCLSLPNVFRNTTRYKEFVIKNHRIDEDRLEEEELYFYYSIDEKEVGNQGLVAIAAQHEMNHFDGKLITDYDVENKPFERDKIKVGRNDKCPCGSGKKFKKCCIGKGEYD